MSYSVVVADNFHYMDDSEHYTLGSYDLLDDAVAAAKQVVDAYLASAYERGMKSSALYDSYKAFGEDPFIVGPEPGRVLFSAWDYARLRCDVLCGARGGTPTGEAGDA
jgi:hypothetical protein